MLGVEVLNPPDTGNVPLVCDMSSNFLTCKVDVSKVRACGSNATVISAISTVHALKVSLSKLRSQSMLRHSRRLSQLNSGSREPNSRERTSLGLNHGKAKNDCEH